MAIGARLDLQSFTLHISRLVCYTYVSGHFCACVAYGLLLSVGSICVVNNIVVVVDDDITVIIVVAGTIVFTIKKVIENVRNWR